MTRQPGADEAPLVIHGWSVFAHPLFLDALEALVTHVERQRQRDPRGYKKKNAAKRLAAIAHLVFDVIPQDPSRAEYRLGQSLGEQHRHWFRAKFFQQYRLFFRWHAGARVIVFAWVNDESTLRAYESANDAYAVFGRMLDRGRPPDRWDQLLAQARRESARLKRSGAKARGG
jgi:toxin YhaV